MRSGILFLWIMAFLTAPVWAGEVTPFKECATLRNMSDQTIMGSVRTAPFKTTNGDVQRHEGAFRLDPDQAATICSTGPFYEGYKVELSIRTIIPLFTCKTRLSGNIMLRKTIVKNGVTKLYADCK